MLSWSGARRAAALLGPVAGLLLLVRRTALVVTVRGPSMEPTMADGDRVIALRWPGARMLPRGAIVVGSLGQALAGSGAMAVDWDAARSALFVKRLTGLPGDTVEFQALAAHQSDQDASRPSTVRLGNGECFVRGDNPTSADSSVWGPLPLGAVTGVVLFRLSRGGQ